MLGEETLGRVAGDHLPNSESLGVGSIEDILEKAQLAVQLRKLSEAEELARRALAIEADNSEALCILSRCALSKDENLDAEKYAREAASSDWHYAFYLLAMALERQDRLDEAEVAIGKALETSVTAPAYLTTAARIQLSRVGGGREAARTAVEDALRADPEYGEALLLKAHLLRLDKDEPEAEKVLKRLISQDPHHTAALNNLASIRYQQGRFREAEELLWEALEEYEERHQELVLDNLLTVARTRFWPSDLWQRWHVLAWRALRLNNPWAQAFQGDCKLATAILTFLALAVGGALGHWAHSLGDDSQRAALAIGILLTCYLTFPLANLWLAREPRNRRLLGSHYLRTAFILILGWSSLLCLLIPQIGNRVLYLSHPALLGTCLLCLFAFLTYAYSIQSRGTKSRETFARWNRLQLKALLPTLILGLFAWVTNAAVLETLAFLAFGASFFTAIAVVLVSIIEIVASLTLVYPLEPLLYE